MSPADLQILRDRIQRALKTVNRRAGDGYEESLLLSDGMVHHYSIKGVKSLAQLEDELLGLFKLVWDMKDYLKEVFKAQGRRANKIEEIVNTCEPLQLIADVANRAKHGVLRDRRSKHPAVLVGIGIEIPQTSMKKMTFEAFSVELDVKNPENITLKGFVTLSTIEGRVDAFDLLAKGITAWETQAMPLISQR